MRSELVLALFDERYEKLIADRPDAKKEMDLVRVSVVKVWQLVQNSTKVNGSCAKWKQLEDRAEADRHNVGKFLDAEALFTGLFHMYAATYKEMGDSLQPSSKELGQEDAWQAERIKRRNRDRNYEVECSIKKQKRPPLTYQNPRPVATNNFFAPRRDLPMENAETGSEGDSKKTSGTNESTANAGHLPSH
jgi:hypothetical protein